MRADPLIVRNLIFKEASKITSSLLNTKKAYSNARSNILRNSVYGDAAMNLTPGAYSDNLWERKHKIDLFSKVFGSNTIGIAKNRKRDSVDTLNNFFKRRNRLFKSMSDTKVTGNPTPIMASTYKAMTGDTLNTAPAVSGERSGLSPWIAYPTLAGLLGAYGISRASSSRKGVESLAKGLAGKVPPSSVKPVSLGTIGKTALGIGGLSFLLSWWNKKREEDDRRKRRLRQYVVLD